MKKSKFTEEQIVFASTMDGKLYQCYRSSWDD